MRQVAMAAVTALSIGSTGMATAAETVRADGSSTVFPITEAVAEAFQNDTDYRMTVGVSGTGGGFSRFCRGDTDISGASRPITEDERAKCEEAGIEYYEIPVGMDAIAVVVNAENDWVDHLTVEELGKLWSSDAEGQITSWSDVRDDFPDRPLSLYAPGTDSGTYDYFTQAVLGEDGSSRGDFTASEDDNVVVRGVANDPGGLGFFGLAYYQENKSVLKSVPIAYEGGEPVEPSVENAEDGSYQPFTRPIFMYVKKSAYEESDAVNAFVDDFVLSAEVLRPLVDEVGYIRLPEEAFDLARENIAEGRTGTAFAGGAQIGVSIEDLLQAERED